MTDKHSADEAAIQWWNEQGSDVIPQGDEDAFVLFVWRAAWEAKQAADVAAVKSERLEHEEGDNCFVDNCSDCVYQQALLDAVVAIRGR